MVFLACKRNHEKTYYDDGSLKSESELLEGSRHGKTVYYFKNKNVQSIINYKNGNRHGEFIEYYENGIIKNKSTFNNDSLDGNSLEYYPNGKIKSEFYFANGGEKFYSNYYDEYGNLNYTDQHPFFEAGDPILDKEYCVKLYIAGIYKVLINASITSANINGIPTSIPIIKNDHGNRSFCFTPKSNGKYNFSFSIDLKNRNDSINKFSFSKEFLVEK